MNPRFCHLGDFFALYTHGGSDRDAVLRTMDLLVEAGWHGPRFWTVLQGPFWSGLECNAGRQQALFHQFGNELKSRNLQACVSQGDMWQDGVSNEDRRLVHEAIRTAYPREALSFCDFANEFGNNGIGSHTIEEGLAWLQGLPGILAGSTCQSEEKPDLHRYSRPPAKVWVEHNFRGGRWFDKLRHEWNDGYEAAPDDRRLGLLDESFGFGTLVSVTENMHELTDNVMAYSVSLAHGARAAIVWFSSPGIKLLATGEKLEDMPGFWSGPKLADKLPKDASKFRRLVHGGSSMGLSRVFQVLDEGGDASTRCDHLLNDDRRFIVHLYGPNPRYAPLQPYVTFEDYTLDAPGGGKMRMIYGQTQ